VWGHWQAGLGVLRVGPKTGGKLTWKYGAGLVLLQHQVWHAVST
jgi:hypothetical protein